MKFFTKENKSDELTKNKYTLNVRFDMNKEPNGEVLWDVIIDALLSYAKKTEDELLVYKIVLVEE